VRLGVIWNKAERQVWESTKTRPCRSCLAVKSWSEFHYNTKSLFGINSICKDCRKSLSKRQYANWSLEYRLFHTAKSRAKLKNREFTITLKNIKIPDVCPILGIKLQRDLIETRADNRPSIDRIDSTKGYTPENIQVISLRANILKNNMTLEEAEKLITYFRRSL
jgi:hypothetical protein